MKSFLENEKLMKKDTTSNSTSAKNWPKLKELSLDESFLKNKHFFTPKTSEEERNIKPKVKNIKQKKVEESKKFESSPITPNTKSGYEIKHKFFNPMHIDSSPDPHTPTPTKLEMEKIFTDDELSNSGDGLKDLERQFPVEIIEKLSKKSRIAFN